MGFLRTLRTDFCRMFLSGKFYSAAGAVAGIALLSVWPEAQSGGYRTSVYYLVNARGGISAFLLAISVLIVVPYALSGREDGSKPLRPLYGIQSGTVELYLVKNYYRFRRGFFGGFSGICPVLRPSEPEASGNISG